MPPTELERERAERVLLSSAVWHLGFGETTSRWSCDSYLERLKKAKSELRDEALALHGRTEADYRDWLLRNVNPEPPHFFRLLWLRTKMRNRSSTQMSNE